MGLILLFTFAFILVCSTALVGVFLKAALRLVASVQEPFAKAWLTVVLYSVAALFIRGIGHVTASYAGPHALGYGVEILTIALAVLAGIAIVASRHELAFWRAALVYLGVQAAFFLAVLVLGLGLGLMLGSFDSFKD